MIGMRLALFAAVALVLVASQSARAAPASALPACPPHRDAGWVALVEPDPSPPVRGVRPTLSRGEADIDVAPGEQLCAGDSLENPAGSGRRVFIRAGRQVGWIAPGQTGVIDPPSFSGWLREHADRFDDVVNSFVGRRLDQQRVRAFSCQFDPVSRPEFVAYAVAEWGPLVVAWPCTSEGPWLVEITPVGAKTVVRETVQNIAHIDMPVLCPKGCEIQVSRRFGGEQVAAVHVVIADPAKAGAPGWIKAGGGDSAAMAALGAYLVTRKTKVPVTWQLQGASLLFGQACRVPAASVLASDIYGVVSPEDFCGEWVVNHAP